MGVFVSLSFLSFLRPLTFCDSKKLFFFRNVQTALVSGSKFNSRALGIVHGNKGGGKVNCIALLFCSKSFALNLFSLSSLEEAREDVQTFAPLQWSLCSRAKTL